MTCTSVDTCTMFQAPESRGVLGFVCVETYTATPMLSHPYISAMCHPCATPDPRSTSLRGAPVQNTSFVKLSPAKRHRVSLFLFHTCSAAAFFSLLLPLNQCQHQIRKTCHIMINSLILADVSKIVLAQHSSPSRFLFSTARCAGVLRRRILHGSES